MHIALTGQGMCGQDSSVGTQLVVVEACFAGGIAGTPAAGASPRGSSQSGYGQILP